MSSDGSVEEMMAKAVTSSAAFYSSRNAVKGIQDHKDDIRQKRKEQKNTLSQWYGMKKKSLSDDEKQELELLKYRNFVNADAGHQAPKRTANGASDFVEFGYFADTGRNKRRRYRSFADEWMEENPEFEDIVRRRINRNFKANQKTKAAAAKRSAAAAEKAKEKHFAKRKSKKDFF